MPIAFPIPTPRLLDELLHRFLRLQRFLITADLLGNISVKIRNFWGGKQQR